MQSFHHQQFPDAAALAGNKRGESIAVCIPTLNEAATIGPIVRRIRRELMETHGLVDELWVIDSGSSDPTRRIARDEGAEVRLADEIAPELGHHRGKGENLWKALLATRAGIVCYLDGDLRHFDPGFVRGLVGPLLEHPGIDYVKAFYRRPLESEAGFEPNGGGRVSEILVRPLLSMFYPEVCALHQPLSGEYAARRELLETLAFPTGYGVEIAHLIDLHSSGRLGRVAQTDLELRTHRNRPDGELGRMAFALLQVILRRLERDGRLQLAAPPGEWYRPPASSPGEAVALPEPERPPLRTLGPRARQALSAPAAG